MYQVQRPSYSESVAVRDQLYHLRRWGQPMPGQAPLVLLHGWMDVSASWQFVVDALQTERCIVAPDWRGFGLTRACHLADATGAGHYGGSDHYAFVDYLADLDALLDHLNGQLGRDAHAPVDLVGHSMGGNVAMLYGGVRPGRVRRLVNLEGFGMPATRPSQAPSRYARWLDELKSLQAGHLDLKPYPSRQAVAQRLMKTNPRLPPERAEWLAGEWAAADTQGLWHILGDAAHKVVNPYLYRVEEVLAVLAHIQAPVLAIEASDDSLQAWFKGDYTLAQYHERLQAVPQHQVAVVANAGHMLHHDQPQAVARLLEAFLD